MDRTFSRASVSWADTELIAETREVWQPYYTRPLTDEDVFEILFATGELLEVLEGETDAA